MKSLVSFAFFLSAVVAYADSNIIKPINTLEPAKGVVSVSGSQFDYSVLDRGWTTSGEIIPKFNIVAEKSFIITYQAQGSLDKSKAAALWIGVRSDADQKCLELGQIEYKGQIASFDQSYTTALSAKIVNASKPTLDIGTVALAAVCLVNVKVSKFR